MKKTYIFFLSVVIIFGIVMFIFFGVPELKKSKNITDNLNIIIGHDTFWSYDKKSGWNVKSKNITYGNQMYNVYINSDYKGKYDIELINDTFYYYDKNVNKTTYSGDLFAYSGGGSIIIKDDYDTSQITLDDIKYVNNLIEELKDTEISIFDLTLNKKIAIDLDNDKKDEYIYILSNFGCENCKNSDYFSIVFIVDNNKASLLSKSYDKTDYYGINFYDLEYILDINNDNNYEIVLSKSTFGNNKTYHQMFEKLKKGYIKTISSGG